MSQLQKTPGEPAEAAKQGDAGDSTELKSAAERAKEMLGKAQATKEPEKLEPQPKKTGRYCCGVWYDD